MTANRAAPLSGLAFIAFFAASVAISNVPGNTAPDTAWVAAYATHGDQARHLATGILLVLAALSLATFLTHLWTRVIVARRAQPVSPLPIVAAGISASCIAAGGVMMAAASGSALLFSQPLPGAALLRLSNDLGFALVSVAGMPAAALSIASLSVQARTAGVMTTRMMRFSLVVSVVLLASVAFVPILALVAWLIIVAATMIRNATPRAPAPTRELPT
jgi:hypothetical protein